MSKSTKELLNNISDRLEKTNWRFTKDSDKLKQLIAEHPDYPIVVIAGDSANNGDYGWMYCSSVRFEIEDFLQATAPYDDEYVCADRDEFEERMQEFIEDSLYDEGIEVSEEELDSLVREAIAMYDPYWTKVIAIYADN